VLICCLGNTAENNKWKLNLRIIDELERDSRNTVAVLSWNLSGSTENEPQNNAVRKVVVPAEVQNTDLPLGGFILSKFARLE
jgi:hypothetical protein